MICRLLRIIYVLDMYKETIDAYANGVRGDKLRNLCFRVFFGEDLTFPKGWHGEILELIGAANDHVLDVEKFFDNRVSFAGMLP